MSAFLTSIVAIRTSPAWTSMQAPTHHGGRGVRAAYPCMANLREEELMAEALGCTVVGRAGSGRFGSVFFATKAEGSWRREVVIKLSPHPSPTLTVEAAVLRSLSGQPGFPTLLSHGEVVGGLRHPWASTSGFDALIMERLGPTLVDEWARTTQRTHFDGQTLLRYGRGLIECLRTLHAFGFVHNDIKPNNIVLSTAGSGCAQEVYLIDFGLTTRSDDGGIRGQRGTPNFASYAAHAGAPTHATDDLESLVYCLAYLASGSLPWMHKRVSRAAFMKRKMLLDGCCASLVEDVPAQRAAEALQALWAEVVRSRQQRAGREVRTVIDYDACFAAFSCGA